MSIAEAMQSELMNRYVGGFAYEESLGMATPAEEDAAVGEELGDAAPVPGTAPYVSIWSRGEDGAWRKLMDTWWLGWSDS